MKYHIYTISYFIYEYIFVFFVTLAINMIALFNIFLSFYLINFFPFVFIYVLTQITENDEFLFIMTSCLLSMSILSITITDYNLFTNYFYMYCIVLFKLI